MGTKSGNEAHAKRAPLALVQCFLEMLNHSERVPLAISEPFPGWMFDYLSEKSLEAVGGPTENLFKILDAHSTYVWLRVAASVSDCLSVMSKWHGKRLKPESELADRRLGALTMYWRSLLRQRLALEWKRKNWRSGQATAIQDTRLGLARQGNALSEADKMQVKSAGRHLWPADRHVQEVRVVGPPRNGNPSGDPRNARRCRARTRKGHECRSPAMANGRCRMHGGASTGPRTAAGLERSQRANWKHGFDSKPYREELRKFRAWTGVVREILSAIPTPAGSQQPRLRLPSLSVPRASLRCSERFPR